MEALVEKQYNKHGMEILPIDAHFDEIVEAIQNNQITLIVGETGSGKSTRIPRIILEAEMSCLVTEPRRLSVAQVANRVADELHDDVGDLVGFCTRFEKKFSKNTMAMICTDGMGVVRELLGNYNYDVLVVDEVHEHNLNMAILLAWIRYSIVQGTTQKFVLMSATVDVEEFSKFFPDLKVIYVEGRTFPVTDVTDDFLTESPYHKNMELQLRAIEYAAAKGWNSLVFVPGKAEIQRLIKSMEDDKDHFGHIVKIPLHGEMTYDEQRVIFNKQPGVSVIVSTNVAETGVTPPFVDCVIDTQMEKQTTINNGVEGLVLKRISKASSSQRKGRAGRVKPGTYINTYTGNEPQGEYTVPEIQRSLVDHVLLKIYAAGLNPDVLTFFHPIPHAVYAKANKMLRDLKLVVNGKITDFGLEIVKYPMNTKQAVMLHHADRHGIFDVVFQHVICQLLNIHDRIGSYVADFHSPMEAYCNMITYILHEEWKDLHERTGIPIKMFVQAKELYNLIYTDNNISTNNDYLQRVDTWDEIKDLVEKCILSGILEDDNIFVYGTPLFNTDVMDQYRVHFSVKDVESAINTVGENNLKHICPNTGRSIGRGNRIKKYSAAAGIPFDVMYKTSFGENRMMYLITQPMEVRSEWVKWFPEKFIRELKLVVSSNHRIICLKELVYYKGNWNKILLMDREINSLIWLTSQNDVCSKFEMDMSRSSIQSFIKETIDITDLVDEETLVTMVKSCIGGILQELSTKYAMIVYDPFTLDVVIPPNIKKVEITQEQVRTVDEKDRLVNKILEKNKPKSAISVLAQITKTKPWRIHRGKYTCPRGHQMSLQQAMKKDPTKLTCPTCGAVGTMSNVISG